MQRRSRRVKSNLQPLKLPLIFYNPPAKSHTWKKKINIFLKSNLGWSKKSMYFQILFLHMQRTLTNKLTSKLLLDYRTPVVSCSNYRALSQDRDQAISNHATARLTLGPNSKCYWFPAAAAAARNHSNLPHSCSLLVFYTHNVCNGLSNSNLSPKLWAPLNIWAWCLN